MRVGTWTLAGRWSDAHATLLREAECDVWLLTEVRDGTELSGHHLHTTLVPMVEGRRWAAVASTRPLVAEPDPHPASACARIGSTTFVSSVLPWRACGTQPPWVGDGHAAKMANAVAALVSHVSGADSLVWGGDWNHALSGREHAGSKGGRVAILDVLGKLGLWVPTADLPHAIDGLLTIDHIAVPRGVPATASHVVAAHDGKRLSDHDAYVVDVGL